MTTFVAVCIPEFLSVYETERLTMELNNYQIEISNIVINQILMNDDDGCKMCNARKKMQKKYIEQIDELFESFYITKLPLLYEEVRGVNNLSEFSKFLMKS